MDAHETPPRDVIVGVDGSPESIAALHFAARYAHALGAPLRVVTAWDWFTFEGVPVTYGHYDPRAEARQAAEEAARITGLPPERVSTVVAEGPAAKLLIRLSEGAQLLVVGCRGHGGFTGLLLGSVSSQCVHHAHCPVVVVRAELAGSEEVATTEHVTAEAEHDKSGAVVTIPEPASSGTDVPVGG